MTRQGFWYNSSVSALASRAVVLAILCVGLIPSEPEQCQELRVVREQIMNAEHREMMQ